MNRHRSVQELVSQLEKPRKMSTPKFKEPIIDREEVRKHMRLKWKDPGYSSIEFSKPPILKPKILNEWEAERIHISLRSYKVPKNSKPYRFDSESRPFPKANINMYSEKFQRYLKQAQSQKEDLLFKENRTMTEGIQKVWQTRKMEATEGPFFKPINSNPSYFGFRTKDLSKKHSECKFRTLVI